MKIDILAIGALKKGSLYDTYTTYHKRIQWNVNLLELESKIKDDKARQNDEQDKLLAKINPQAFVFALDERGKSLPSSTFADKIKDIQNGGQSHIQFILGGADGLTEAVRQKSNFLLSFGAQTWPHMLARVMLLEQIYRAQQILSGHPYHRE